MVSSLGRKALDSTAEASNRLGLRGRRRRRCCRALSIWAFQIIMPACKIRACRIDMPASGIDVVGDRAITLIAPLILGANQVRGIHPPPSPTG